MMNNMSHVMSKCAFCICENKATNQLCGNRAADQRLCFCSIDSTTPILPISCCRTDQFVSDLVGNPEDRFPRDTAHTMACFAVCLSPRMELSYWLGVKINELHHKKSNILVSNLVRYKPGCTATEDGYKLEISDLESRGIVLSM